MRKRTLDLTFAGAAGGDFPATWSQREFWWTINHHRPGGFYQIFWSVSLPQPWDVREVLGLLRCLVVRHQALRTTMRVEGDGSLRQVIAAAGTLPVRVAELPEPAAARAVIAGLSDEFSRNEPDLQRGFPLRIVLLTVAGRATCVVLSLSHVFLDGGSAAVLTEELHRLAAGPLHDTERILGPVLHQPSDQARDECGPRGREISRKSLAHWRSVLLDSSPGLFPGVEAGHAPLWIGSLKSRALRTAEDVLGQGTGLPSSAVYLGATCCVLGAMTGTTRMTFRIPAGNRLTATHRDFVGALSQHAVMTVDLGAATTFHELVRLVGRGLVRAYSRTRYDPDDLRQVIREVEAARGHPCDLTYLFNDLRPEERKRHRAGRHTPSPGDVPAAPDTSASDISWDLLHSSNGDIKLHVKIRVSADDGDPVVAVGADESCMPRPRVATALLGMERLLVSAARQDFDLTDVPRLARLPTGPG